MHKARHSQAGDCIECCKLVEHSFGVQDGMRAFQLEAISLSLSLSLSDRESKQEPDRERRVFVNFAFIF